MNVATGELLPYAGWALSAATLIGGWVVGKRGRRASAVKDEADAAESLSATVAALGAQVQELYGRLSAAENRAAAAEARAAASDLRAATADAEVLRLREEVAQLRAELAAARRATDGSTTVVPVDHVQVALVTAPHPDTESAPGA